MTRPVISAAATVAIPSYNNAEAVLQDEALPTRDINLAVSQTKLPKR